MREGEPVNENESKSQTAAGSGNSPEKLVADFVESSWDHITENRFDLLADVAIDMLTKNGSVPSDAYLHAVKTSWCLHRAAVHYARQHSVERGAADRARGDAQFEYSLRAQAERKAEKLEAELAQSVLLVENQRLRMEEMRQEMEGREQQAREVRQQMLETAESALLEQQQRNEQLVTEGSQQRMKIAELEQLLANKKRRISELETMVIDLRNINTTAEKSVEAAGRQNYDLQAQVKFLKDREATLGTRLEEEKAVTTKRLDQIQELRSEVSHVQRLWGESRRRVEELEQQMQDKQEPAIPAGGGLLRDVSHYTEMAETDTPDADVSAEQQIRTLQEIIEAQAETIARLHSEVSALNTKVSGFERMQKDDRMADSGTLDAEPQAEPQPEPQRQTEPPADCTPTDGWRVLQAGEVIQAGDMWVRADDGQLFDARRIGPGGEDGAFIRRIEPQPVQVCEGRWRNRRGEVRNVTRTPHDLSDDGRYPWHDAERCQTWYDNGRYFHEKESPFDLHEFIGPIDPEPGSEQIAS